MSERFLRVALFTFVIIMATLMVGASFIGNVSHHHVRMEHVAKRK